MGTFCEVAGTVMQSQISRNNAPDDRFGEATVCVDRLEGQSTVLSVFATNKELEDYVELSVRLSTESMRYLIDALQAALDERYEKSM